MKNRVQLSVIYEGQVQGVGFRFTAIRYAQQLDLDGYVRNMPDGSVELVAQGPRSKLVELLQDIRSSSLGAYIYNESILWSDVTTPMGTFTIRY